MSNFTVKSEIRFASEVIFDSEIHCVSEIAFRQWWLCFYLYVNKIKNKPVGATIGRPFYFVLYTLRAVNDRPYKVDIIFVTKQYDKNYPQCTQVQFIQRQLQFMALPIHAQQGNSFYINATTKK